MINVHENQKLIKLIDEQWEGVLENCIPEA